MAVFVGDDVGPVLEMRNGWTWARLATTGPGHASRRAAHRLGGGHDGRLEIVALSSVLERNHSSSSRQCALPVATGVWLESGPQVVVMLEAMFRTVSKKRYWRQKKGRKSLLLLCKTNRRAISVMILARPVPHS